jgi:hypothetical protein
MKLNILEILCVILKNRWQYLLTLKQDLKFSVVVFYLEILAIWISSLRESRHILTFVIAKNHHLVDRAGLVFL